jgi:hypothetical protein
METLNPPGMAPIPPWHAGTPAADASHKVNTLLLPDGVRP